LVGNLGTERYGIAWFWLAIWELRDMGKGAAKGRDAEEENARQVAEM
jgi:hypothetical protein